jgi:hypothetical protein
MENPMSKEKIFEILSLYDPNERVYDQYASLRIDTAAKIGQDLTIDKAYESLRTETQFKEKSKQKERLKAVQDICSPSRFISKKDEEKHYRSLFGTVDLDDQKFLDQYRFDVHDNRKAQVH